MSATYTPSGKVGRPAILALTLVPAALAGIATAALVSVVPPSTVRLALTLVVLPVLLSLLLAVSVNWLLAAGHVRNRAVGRALGMAAGAAAAWSTVAWIPWFAAWSEGDPAPLASVASLAPFTTSLQYGDGPAVPGFALLAVGLLFAGVPVLLSPAATDRPYCEPCGRWAGRYQVVAQFEADDRLDAAVRAWDIDALVRVRAADDRAPEIDSLEAARCPACSAFAVARLLQIQHDPERWVREKVPPRLVPGADLDRLAAIHRVPGVGPV